MIILLPMSLQTTIITTSNKPMSPHTFSLQQELNAIIPNSISIPYSSSYPQNSILVKIVEHRGRPFILRITFSSEASPGFSNIEFNIIQYKSIKQMQRKPISSFLSPELVVSGFESETGEYIVDALMKLFPMVIGELSNRAVSFHAVNDFILFRTHRYKFKDSESVSFQDIGPHITLRLRKIIKDGEEKCFDYRKKLYNEDKNTVL